MQMSRRNFMGSIAAIGVSTALSGCGQQSPVLTVGSKDFTEEMLLGEMYAQLLEHHGIKVRRRLGLGGTQVAMEALQRGAIDLYPEYTGTGLLVVLQQQPIANAELLYKTVAQEYQRRFNLTWLDQAPMNDTQALAMRSDLASKLNITTITDLAKHASALRIGVVPEFLHRADGLPGLQKAYGGLHFQETRVLDSGIKYQALMNRDVDLVVAFGTDGYITADHLLVLLDNKRFWPEYHVAPVVRDAALTQFPAIATILNPLSRLLTTETMQRLNGLADVQKQDIVDIASAFLQSARLAGKT
jgi:osmoprotectant transport system substrate-binding protein